MYGICVEIKVTNLSAVNLMNIHANQTGRCGIYMMRSLSAAHFSIEAHVTTRRN